MVTRFDAIVIGTGQAGPPLASRLSDEGFKTAVIERKYPGGTCVNTGCIPTKTLVASARVAHLAHRAAEYGVTVPGSIGSRSRDCARKRGRHMQGRMSDPVQLRAVTISAPGRLLPL